MNRTVVLDVAGLSGHLLGPHTPHLARLARRGGTAPIRTITPAVTSSVQSTFLTGAQPSAHGCVGNGWYVRDLEQIWLSRQSSSLVEGERVWDVARAQDAAFTVASLFWCHNLYGAADWSVTPRSSYPTFGREFADLYSQPCELRDELTDRFGTFPLLHYWGPKADLRSTQWIADAARYVYDTRRPTLSLVYLPQLSYDLQRLGPDHPGISDALEAIDAVCGELIDHVRQDGARVLVLSEYGVTAVSDAVHINRALRHAGLLAVRDDLGSDALVPGASEALAVADHQIAHVYVRRPERLAEVASLLRGLDGVERVLDADTKRSAGLDHPRSGDLVAIARADRWFSYYHWLDDRRAPDYAHTVDHQRKPGHDPCELLLDQSPSPLRLNVNWPLATRTLDPRAPAREIPLDASLVRGSYGRPTDEPLDGPIAISSEPALLSTSSLPATEVKSLILDHLFGRATRSLKPPAPIAAGAASR